MRSNAVDLEEYEGQSNYIDLQRQLAHDSAWPPIGQKTSIRLDILERNSNRGSRL